MKHIKLDQVEEKELYPGFIARIIHTKLQSISYVRCLKGAVLPPHKHAEEQVLNLLEGEMNVTVDGRTVHCKAGDVVHIPSNAVHTVTAITECLAIDLFAPQREAYIEYGTRTF
ncbi:MAG: cupin domain-containing protein [Saprospiraceae bacterium]|nr:cupin domain-containing protein [Saprospiraceae bacterium]